MTTPPTERPVSPLRQRMLDDMAMRTMRSRTQHDYVRHVRAFAGFLGRSPDTATAEDVRRFQLHQREHGVGESTINGSVSALRFLFDVTLERPDLSRRLVLAHCPRKLPDVLSVDEVAKLLEAAPGIGARIGITAVLHTWGSAMTHHPHIHMIVPGGGLSPDGNRWVSSRPAFLLPVRVLGKLFRRLFLARLMALHEAGRLAFFGSIAHLAGWPAFLRHLALVRKKRWVVYAKPPFAGPEAVLAYLSRYTHRVAISNSRLIGFDESGVTLRYKDYRRAGADRQQVMTLAGDEFIRRFLLHVLPKGFHRIRHYGLLASSARKASLARARQLLGVAPPPDDAPENLRDVRPPCPCCGGQMVVIETFERWRQPRAPPHPTVPPGTIAP
jgi:hypothetical protein